MLLLHHTKIHDTAALTTIPPGHMDADHLQDIELWMKNAYVAAVDTSGDQDKQGSEGESTSLRRW